MVAIAVRLNIFTSFIVLLPFLVARLMDEMGWLESQ